MDHPTSFGVIHNFKQKCAVFWEDYAVAIKRNMSSPVTGHLFDTVNLTSIGI